MEITNTFYADCFIGGLTCSTRELQQTYFPVEKKIKIEPFIIISLWENEQNGIF